MVQKTFLMTEAQDRALKALSKKLQYPTASETLRYLILKECDKRGVQVE